MRKPESRKPSNFGQRLLGFLFPRLDELGRPEDAYPEGTQMLFTQVVSSLPGAGREKITRAAVDRILDAFIFAVDREGFSCGGEVSPLEPETPDCQRCHGRGILPAEIETPLSVLLAEDKRAANLDLTPAEKWILIEWYAQLQGLTIDEIRHEDQPPGRALQAQSLLRSLEGKKQPQTRKERK